MLYNPVSWISDAIKKERGTTVSVLSVDCFCYSPLGILAEMKLRCNHPEHPAPPPTTTTIRTPHPTSWFRTQPQHQGGCLGTGVITSSNDGFQKQTRNIFHLKTGRQRSRRLWHVWTREKKLGLFKIWGDEELNKKIRTRIQEFNSRI